MKTLYQWLLPATALLLTACAQQSHSLYAWKDYNETVYERLKSDGKPITAYDVAFSYRTLVRDGHPQYRTNLQEVKRVDILNRHRIRFVFKRAGNPLLILRLGELPVYVTNQVPTVGTAPAKNVAILGDWSQVMLGLWGEVDLLVNPFDSTAYARGGVLVRAMATCDIAVRHPTAFVFAEDIAI